MQQIPSIVITEGWEDFWKFIKSTNVNTKTKNEWELIEASQMSLCGTERIAQIEFETESFVENTEEYIVKKLVEDIFNAVQDRADSVEWEQLTTTGLSRLGSQVTMNTESYSLVSEANTQEQDDSSVQRNKFDSSQESLVSINYPIIYDEVEPIDQSALLVPPISNHTPLQTILHVQPQQQGFTDKRFSSCFLAIFRGPCVIVGTLVGHFFKWQESFFGSCRAMWERSMLFSSRLAEYYRKKFSSLTRKEVFSLGLGLATGGLLLGLYFLNQQKAAWRMRACRAQQDIMGVMLKMEELQGAVLMSRYPILGLTSNFVNF